jgi:hypothetical protein
MDVEIIKQILVLAGVCITAYFGYISAKNSREANNAVNHKGEGEQTLRENVLEIRTSMLDLREQFLHFRADFNKHVEKHP